MQHVFLVGAKSFGSYGGYETFINKLTEYHQYERRIKYHVAVKANGQGAGIPDSAIKCDGGYIYHNSECFEIPIPEFLGAAQAIYYDCVALRKTITIINQQNIKKPIIYIMACRIGPFINKYVQEIHNLGEKIILNPDGHEWMRGKWSIPVRRYWKYSEKRMVIGADLIVCDSLNIERYIQETYGVKNTTYIAYGAEIKSSECDEKNFINWLDKNGLKKNEYYSIVGRFVPENNYEIMIREYMNSNTQKNLAIITTDNDEYFSELEEKLHFSSDQRIKFVGSIYEQELLKKIREESYGYLHGHEVGGTNPSLLEALASTKLNLLLNTDFNEETAEDAALYWTKEEGNLAALIDKCEKIDRECLGKRAKERIRNTYSWQYIADRYAEIWLNS